MASQKLAIASAIALLAGGQACGEPLRLGAPLGVSWGSAYGFPPYKDEVFVPQARALGASFTRLTLYWSQLEPKPGVRRWTDLDSYLAQITNPEEGFLTLESASPWATRNATWVFPSSPAKTSADYYAFVYAVVKHSNGRIRYFQSDQEPNNPFFWSGSPEEYAAQHRLFYRAVKNADPNAVVVLGGCDGLFDPTGQHPLPGQAADMAFFSKVIGDAAGAFDLFDLRLYGDAYAIGARLQFVRQTMAKAGGVKPVIASEYNGPGFFEFAANRRWAATLTNPESSAETLRKLVASADALPVETRMFLPNASLADTGRFQALAADDLVIRNVLALAAGVQKTAFFDLWHDPSQGGAANGVMFGSFKLLDRQDGVLSQQLPLAAAFSRLAGLLSGARAVARIEDAARPDIFIFRVTRKGQTPLWVAWRRPAKLGDDAGPAVVDVPWLPRDASASTLLGAARPIHAAAPARQLSIGSSPIFIQ